MENGRMPKQKGRFSDCNSCKEAKEMNPKELTHKTFKGREIPRPPFFPFLGTLLAKIEQKSMEECLVDPSALMTALYNARQLFGYDAITLPPDCTVEAEAFGASIHWGDLEMPEVKSYLPIEERIEYTGETWLDHARIACRLETVKRLVTVYGKSLPVIVTITGPYTVFKHIYGDEAFRDLGDVEITLRLETICKALMELCIQYGNLKVDGIIIYEEVEADILSGMNMSVFYKPLCNVVRFYNIPILLRMIPSNPCTSINLLFSFDGFIGVDKPHHTDLFNAKGVKGITISSDSFPHEDSGNWIRQYFKDSKKRNMCLFTSHSLDHLTNISEFRDTTEAVIAETLWNMLP
jgi:hypothetical protein